MSHRHRGRHARPSVTSKVITTGSTAASAAAVAAVVFSSGAANAAVLPGGGPQVQVTARATLDTPALFHKVTEAPQVVTVQPGDSLSGIAKRDCGKTGDWTGLYMGNRKVVGPDPDFIVPGERLILDCTERNMPVQAPVRVAYKQTQQAASSTTDTVQASYGGNVNPNSYSGFQQCVITRESGGNSQVMNSSGHYGLYQFSASTWEAYGGSAADFGHASVAEQNRVFANAMAQGGQSNWSPYDGC